MTIAELTKDLDQTEFEFLSQECQAFEQLLQACLRSLAKITATDQRWKDGLRAKTLQFDFQFDKEITRRYRNWLINARLCLQQLEVQEAKDCHPESANEFRACLNRAEETLLVRTQDEAAAIAALQDVE
jgi:hypothetical protein